MSELTQIREKINSIDAQILELFSQRMEVAREVAANKAQSGKPVYDATRERENIQRATEQVPQELASYAAVLQSVLMDATRDVQYRQLDAHSPLTFDIQAALREQPALFPKSAYVGCQGVEGAYQQLAVERFFRRPQISYFDTFEGVFRAVEEGFCEYGVVPLENSSAGSVKRVYDLMVRHKFHIVRSCRLKIDHNLLVPAGSSLEDVRIVYSHEQAIQQCAEYLSHIPDLRIHVCENTAKAAERVANLGRSDVAAIASRECAQLYGLEIAERSIQDRGNNYTRFACISKDLSIYPGADRTSLMMVVNHEPGSLYKVLSRFYSLDINLIKLESRPIPERDFEFMFYFDIECPVAAPEFMALTDSLADVCEELRYFGSYSEVV